MRTVAARPIPAIVATAITAMTCRRMRPFVSVLCSVVVLVGAVAVVRLVSASSSPTAPGQATCAAPSDVGGIDLTGWKVTLPTGPEEDPTEIEQPELTGFIADPWFVPTEDCTGIRFRSAVNGVTTGGSQNPRSELREMIEDGSNEAKWSVAQGTHTMTVRGMVTHLPDVKPQVVAAQVHGGSDDLTAFRLEGSSFYVTNDNEPHHQLITDSYELGTPYELRFVAGGGEIQAYFDGQLVTTIQSDSSTAYFKTGAYTQAHCENSDPCDETNYGETVICGVEVTHEGTTAGPTDDEESAESGNGDDSSEDEDSSGSESGEDSSSESGDEGSSEGSSDESGSESSNDSTGDESSDDSSTSESGSDDSTGDESGDDSSSESGESSDSGSGEASSGDDSSSEGGGDGASDGFAGQSSGEDESGSESSDESGSESSDDSGDEASSGSDEGSSEGETGSDESSDESSGDDSSSESSGDDSSSSSDSSTPTTGSDDAGGSSDAGAGCGDGGSVEPPGDCPTESTGSESSDSGASDSGEGEEDSGDEGSDDESADDSDDDSAGDDRPDDQSGADDEDSVDDDSDYEVPPPAGPLPGSPNFTGFAGSRAQDSDEEGSEDEESGDEESGSGEEESGDDEGSDSEDSDSSSSDDSSSSESEAGESTADSSSDDSGSDESTGGESEAGESTSDESTSGETESDESTSDDSTGSESEAGESTSNDGTGSETDTGESTSDSGGAAGPCDSTGELEPESDTEPETDSEPAPTSAPVDDDSTSSGTCLPQDAQPTPGDTVCFSENLAEPLEITTGGTEGAPVHYQGDGIEVPGIRVNADHVVVEGFVSSGAEGTGIEVQGDGITVQGNLITQVAYNGDDVDGIRFFGDGIQLLDNHVFDLEASADIGDAHIDCMQTFATSGPGSSDIVIQGNRCEQIRSQCLMAEGPNDEGGSGEGESRNWLFDGNYCDSHAAAQSVALEDIQDVTISNNEMVGSGNKAFALGAGTTGTVVRGNQIGPEYGTEVGFDDPSAAESYDGPPVADGGS